MDVVAKLRQRGEKAQPPKLLCDIKMAFFFFWKMPKTWVGRTTLNGEKKGMAFLARKKMDWGFMKRTTDNIL